MSSRDAERVGQHLRVVRVGERQHRIGRADHQRIEALLEHPDLEQVDQRPGTEQAHEPEDRKQDGGEHADALHRMHRHEAETHSNRRVRRPRHGVGLSQDLVGVGEQDAVVAVVVAGRRQHLRRHPWDGGVRQGIDELLGPLVLWGDRHHHGDAQDLAQARRVDLAPSLFQLVVHVEDQHGRLLELGQLEREQQGPPEVLGVRHLHDGRARSLIEQLTGDSGFIAARRQIVDPRRVHDLDLAPVEGGFGPYHLDRGPGVVGDRDVAAGEVLEQNTLPDIGIAYEYGRLPHGTASLLSGKSVLK